MADGGRTPYLGSAAADTTRVPYLGAASKDTTRAPYLGGAKQTHHGLLGTIVHDVAHTVAKTGQDFYDAAVQSPTALYQLHEALAAADPSNPRHLGHSNTKPIEQLGKAYVKQTKETVEHPLRHPGDTLLLGASLFSGGASAVGRVGAASKALKAGEGVAKAAKAAAKPAAAGERVLKVGDLEAKGHYSRAAGSRVIQKTVDKALVKGADKSVRVENQLHKRAAKWEDRNARVADAKARAVGTRVAALGHKLKPEEQRALRLVAEETPVARRIGAHEMRKANAKPAEAARHQERIDLTKKAQGFLDEGPGGKPVFKPEASKLKNVYAGLEKASGDREGLLKNLDLMDEASQQAAKTKVARIAAGARYGKSEAPLDVAKVKMGDKVLAPGVDGLAHVTAVDRGAGTVRVRAYDKGAQTWHEASYPATDLGKPTKATIGAEEISASPDAVFVGNPVERAKATGRPKVSSTGTFGHTTKPSSLKTSTGASVEHALERNDVTNIVAERHAEAVRLSAIHRRADRVAAAGEKTPRRKDDVFVWTNKTVSNQRIPKEVRKYLDNPEGIRRLPEKDQESVTDQLKAALLERHDWQADPESKAEFENLAEKGDGVFVPRRLLGNLAKPSPNIAAVPGIRAVDAINNAQKAALVYLKVNYPVVQAFSNVAMGLIQQGFALPANLMRAALLSRAVGADTAAVIDDLMGQGAVMQAAFHGEGGISHVSQKIAHVMSHGVDTPARRAAFIHEADKAGFGTGAKLKSLVDDDQNADALAEVTQRAKEAIVDYEELSPVERTLIRRLIFVYPWQKGATKYAGNFLRDHPVQAAAVGQLGQSGAQINDQTLGPVPSYLAGIFGVGGGKTVNPNGVNFLQTPGQIGMALTHPTSGLLQDFLAPAPAAAVAALTGKNDIGIPLSKNPAAAARQVLVEPTPIAALARAAGADRSVVVRDLFGSKTASKTYPNPNDALWRFLFAGLYPRDTSKPALNSNAALEKTGR